MDSARIYDITQVRRLASESGVASDIFDGWSGHELALYEDRLAISANVGVATRIAHEKALRRDWVLDLGDRARGLPQVQGEALHSALTAANVPFETGSVAAAYVRRTTRVLMDHADIIRDLATR